MNNQYSTLGKREMAIAYLEQNWAEMEMTSKNWVLRKHNLYWICQIGGWGAFFAFGMLTLHDQDALNWYTALDTLCTVTALMVFTHFFRHLITKIFGALLSSHVGIKGLRFT